MSFDRVVNIALLVLVLIVFAILSKYWCKYRRYISYAVSTWVSATLFPVFFGNRLRITGKGVVDFLLYIVTIELYRKMLRLRLKIGVFLQ